jgi:hypothetical protein
MSHACRMAKSKVCTFCSSRHVDTVDSLLMQGISPTPPGSMRCPTMSMRYPHPLGTICAGRFASTACVTILEDILEDTACITLQEMSKGMRSSSFRWTWRSSQFQRIRLSSTCQGAPLDTHKPYPLRGLSPPADPNASVDAAHPSPHIPAFHRWAPTPSAPPER